MRTGRILGVTWVGRTGRDGVNGRLRGAGDLENKVILSDS
jgi:hypothetical protein